MMRLNLLICLSALTFGAQVKAQVDSASPPAPFVWPSPSFVWDPVHRSCEHMGNAFNTDTDENAQKMLLDEVIELASHARTMMKAFEEGTGDAFLMAQTKASFNLLFDVQLPDATERWNQVKSALDQMISLRDQEHLYIMCDDAIMIEHRSDGLLQRRYPHDQSKTELIDTSVPAYCAAGLGGYRLGWKQYSLSAEWPVYVVICFGGAPPPATTVRQVASSVASGSSLEDFQTWTVLMFHEFLHVRAPGMKEDGERGGERYGMPGALEVRSTYAPQNPDSVTLFALSLALDGWIWLDGKAMSREDYEAWQASLAQGQQQEAEQAEEEDEILKLRVM
ncbi:hypothetical protein CC79DRAFT_1358838 [Sarocladium strictum]